MATISIPKRVCDRPGCSNTVTENGGRYALWSFSDGKASGPVSVAQAGSFTTSEAEMRDRCSVDLCRSCAEGIGVWWTAKVRRAAAKEGASQ